MVNPQPTPLINMEPLQLPPPMFSSNLSICCDELPSVPGSIEIDYTKPDASVPVEDNNDKRSLVKAAIVTIFPSTRDPKWLQPETYFPSPCDVIDYWCGQFEAAPDTGKLHAHLYVEFNTKNRMRFLSMTKVFGEAVGIHPNVRRCRTLSKRNRQRCVNYCLKPESRLTCTPPFIWDKCKSVIAFDDSVWDERSTTSKNTNKSKQEKTQEIIDYIESKPMSWTWDQIVHESIESKYLLASCSWGPKYHAGRHADTARRVIQEVVILYGAGGTGKTTIAKNWKAAAFPDLQSRYYRRNPDDGHFWGGGRTAYRAQPVIHFEEFAGNEPFGRIKEVCDIGSHGPYVNVKGAGTELNHETVIFTSNTHPAGWYRKLWHDDAKQFHPFWRRVTTVWFFPAHRPDGSLNVPDEEHPPHFEDHTDFWKSTKGDYTELLAQSEAIWPLCDLQFFEPERQDYLRCGPHPEFSRKATDSSI